jgi:hypothetical protein
MLPLLIALFLISYALMATLVVEQGLTIENQRSLIQSLFNDSNELSHMKTKQQKQRADAQAQAAAKDHSQVQTPSSQDTPRDHAKKSHSAGKLRKPLPEKPPTSGSDTADERRVVLRI